MNHIVKGRSTTTNVLGPEEAYALLKKAYPGKVAHGGRCCDFGKFYAFFMVDKSAENSENLITGIFADAVDKKTGKVFIYDVTSNVPALNKAKGIQLGT